MSLAKLSKRAIDGIAPVDRPTIVYDDELKGFGVRVMPSGRKAWIVEFRPNGGGRKVPTKRMTLGPATTLTPEEARNAARDILAAVRLGHDPAAERTKHRQTPTVREFVDRYLIEEAQPKLKPGTIANYRIYLRKHAVPAIGGLKVSAVSPSDIAKLHRDIGRSKPVTANRVVEALSSVFRHAATVGVVEKGFNPTLGISAFREKRRERFLSTDELQRLGAALREAETVGLPWTVDESKSTAKHLAKPGNRHIVVSPHVTAVIRLLLFTGCRLREILHLKWEHVDFERGLLFLADSKTGRKTVILNAPALEVLTGLDRLGPYVVPGGDPEKPRADLKRPWEAMAKRAGLHGVRLHDLRHTYASFGAGGGFGLPIIGKLLGHTQASTTQRYAHLDADPLRRASDAIGGRIAAALDGRRGGSVVQLKGARRRR